MTRHSLVIFVGVLSACAPGPTEAGPRAPAPEPTVASTSAPELGAPEDKEKSCVASGGSVVTDRCCAGAGDFPDTCGTGACSCSPSGKVDTRMCRCPTDQCFDGTKCKRL